LVSNETGIPVWGLRNPQYYGQNPESAYWTAIRNQTTDYGNPDPYRKIDTGIQPGDSYQAANSEASKGAALTGYLIPEIRNLWWDRDLFFLYIDRWANTGALTLPDNCAPYTGYCRGTTTPCTSTNQNSVCGNSAPCVGSINDPNYRVTYGPDPNHPGDCIHGSGRFTDSHGTTGPPYYRSQFVDDMWDAYR
jgi:hypothetical protein